MDAVTHTVVAVAIGMAGHRHWGRRGILGVAAAANLPELERAIALGSPAAWVQVVYGAGHSLLTAPLLGVLLAAAVARRLASWKTAALLVGLGLGSHVALDLLSGPGVRLLWPLSRQFYGLRLVARYDLLILAVLAAALIAPRLLNLVNRDMGAALYSPQRPARAGLAAVVLLLAARAVLLAMVESRTDQSGSFALSPSAIHPLTWYSVADAGSTYTVEEITPWSDGPTMRLRKAQPNRAFETAAETPLAQAFLEIAQFPQYSLERGEKGMLVRIRDLRFFSPGGHGKEYSVEIEVTPQLQVVGQRARM